MSCVLTRIPTSASQMDLGKEIVSMVNKSFELVKQANERAKQLSILAGRIDRMDTVISAIENDKLLVICGFEVQSLFGNEVANVIRQSIRSSLTAVKNQNEAELEQLLGVQQKTLSPEMKVAITDAASKESDETGKSHCHMCEPDPVEEKLKGILQDEAKRIESDKSLDKYPAPKKDGRKKYPENMTIEAVQKMYIDEGKTKKEIAEYFGVKESAVNNFMYLKGISRRKGKSKKSDKKSDEKERP